MRYNTHVADKREHLRTRHVCVHVCAYTYTYNRMTRCTVVELPLEVIIFCFAATVTLRSITRPTRRPRNLFVMLDEAICCFPELEAAALSGFRAGREVRVLRARSVSRRSLPSDLRSTATEGRRYLVRRVNREPLCCGATSFPRCRLKSNHLARS